MTIDIDRLEELAREAVSENGVRLPVYNRWLNACDPELFLELFAEVRALRTENQRLWEATPAANGFDHTAPYGKEAEELRAGVEDILKQEDDEGIRSALVRLLDEVDARDSLAHLESLDETTAAAKAVEALESIGEQAKVELDRLRGREALTEAIIAHNQPPWSPIETAPKDGTQVLAVMRFAPSVMHVVWWSKVYECWLTDGISEALSPSHWMPLPPLPEAPR